MKKKGYVTLTETQREQAKEAVATALKGIHDEITQAVAAEIDAVGLVDPEDLYGTDSYIYSCYRMYRGHKRTDSGVQTEHGVVNSISWDNTHAGDVLHKTSEIVKGCGLWADGATRGKRKDDYFFWEHICFEGDVLFDMPFVINSPQITMIYNLYTLLCIPDAPIPDTWTI